MPSLVVDAGVSPWPAVHEVIVTSAHGFPFVPALKFVPATQLEHSPSVVVVAGVSPLPGVHDVILCEMHAPVSSNALNVFPTQVVQVESDDALPIP